MKSVGNKADLCAVVVRNAEASASIPAGSPVVLVMNGTNDGLDVVLPSTSASLQKVQGLQYGVNTRTMAAGDYGESIVFGFTPTLLLERQTRVSSSNVWASEAARSVGEYLSIDTVNNYWVTTVSTYGVVTNATTDTIAVQHRPLVALGQTLASYASSASSTADTRTAITASVKAFVRLM
jgi:uncharacterized protein (DUF1501 family)